MRLDKILLAKFQLIVDKIKYSNRFNNIISIIWTLYTMVFFMKSLFAIFYIYIQYYVDSN